MVDISYYICLTEPPPIELITSKYKCKAGDRTIIACNHQPFHSSLVTFSNIFISLFGQMVNNNSSTEPLNWVNDHPMNLLVTCENCLLHKMIDHHFRDLLGWFCCGSILHSIPLWEDCTFICQFCCNIATNKTYSWSCFDGLTLRPILGRIGTGTITDLMRVSHIKTPP